MFTAAEKADQSWQYINLSRIYECRNWETQHYKILFLEITVSLLGTHKWEPAIYIGFSPALHLQCGVGGESGSAVGPQVPSGPTVPLSAPSLRRAARRTFGTYSWCKSIYAKDTKKDTLFVLKLRGRSLSSGTE
jgi:hypothetical protein